MITITVNEREHAAILAGLRVLANMIGGRETDLDDIKPILDNLGDFTPIGQLEIDLLGDRLNGIVEGTPA